ncbi:hypothetical protein BK654_15870 [Pseudomonas brassicacearum]|uniref:hypothetical protein n=1 Tax=Pseudomonas brassicacearum TaxID=930166 RepID=UPI000FF4CE87|nr:hypothetical protein [Pseudomonas brassicacearum]ROM76123.1 hypothetical protein BK654_15870 [Pseudomonas brassicacearum]
MKKPRLREKRGAFSWALLQGGVVCYLAQQNLGLFNCKQFAYSQENLISGQEKTLKRAIEAELKVRGTL